MQDLDVRSSDLELARRLTQRLTSRLGGTELDPVGADIHERIRIQPPAARRTTRRPTQAPAAPAAFAEPIVRAVPDPPADGFPSWDMFLKWCLQASGSGSACVVDGEGFAIAFLGGLSPASFEGLGAELSLAMRQFRQIDMLAEPLEAAALQYGSRWLTGIRCEWEEESFVLGLISESPLPKGVRVVLLREFVGVLPQLA